MLGGGRALIGWGWREGLVVVGGMGVQGRGKGVREGVMGRGDGV